jgi:hypothetical protein
MKSVLAQLLFLAPALALAQSPASWSFSSARDSSGAVVVELVATLDTGWHLYATELPSNEGPVPTSFRFTGSQAFTLSGPLQEPTPEEEYDPNFAMVVRYHGGTPRFRQKLVPVAPGPFTVNGELEYMVCNDITCLPPVVVPFTIPVSDHQ